MSEKLNFDSPKKFIINGNVTFGTSTYPFEFIVTLFYFNLKLFVIL